MFGKSLNSPPTKPQILLLYGSRSLGHSFSGMAIRVRRGTGFVLKIYKRPDTRDYGLKRTFSMAGSKPNGGFTTGAPVSRKCIFSTRSRDVQFIMSANDLCTKFLRSGFLPRQK